METTTSQEELITRASRKKPNKAISHLGKYLPKHIFAESLGALSSLRSSYNGESWWCSPANDSDDPCKNVVMEIMKVNMYISFVAQPTQGCAFALKLHQLTKFRATKCGWRARMGTDGILLPCNKWSFPKNEEKEGKHTKANFSRR